MYYKVNNLFWCEVASIVFFADPVVRVLSPGQAYSEKEIRDLQIGVRERDQVRKRLLNLVLMLSIITIYIYLVPTVSYFTGQQQGGVKTGNATGLKFEGRSRTRSASISE